MYVNYGKELNRDLTKDEKRRITNILGAGDESNEEAATGVPNLPLVPMIQSAQTPFIQPVALLFACNQPFLFQLCFRKPKSEDEEFGLEIPFFNLVVSSSLPLTFKHRLIFISFQATSSSDLTSEGSILRSRSSHHPT